MEEGNATYSPATDTYTVTADGGDIWFRDDGFRYTYLQVPAGVKDFKVSVRVDGPPARKTWENPWIKAGIMVRQDLDADSAFMTLAATQDNGMVQFYRAEKGESAARQGGDASKQPYLGGGRNFVGPVWLKLERRGNLFVGHYSYNGSQWVRGSVWEYPAEHTIEFEEPFYVGICLTSHEGGVLTDAVFGDFSFARLPPLARSVTQDFSAPLDPSEWELYGIATHDPANHWIQLTPDAADQFSSIFYKRPFNTAFFRARFDIYCGDKDGADGIVFAFVKEPGLGIEGYGGQMAFLTGLDGYGIEFDTFPARGGTPGNQPDTENHVGVSMAEPGMTPGKGFALYQNDNLPYDLENGTWFSAEVEFRSGHVRMWMWNDSISWTKQLVIDYTIPGCQDYDAYLGFTAATGDMSNLHAVDNVTFSDGAAVLEDFEDLAADVFNEVGGTWEVREGLSTTPVYFQAEQDTPGPYRSWLTAGDLTEYTFEADFVLNSGQEAKFIYAHADTGEEYRVGFWLDRSRLCIPAWGQVWGTRNFTVGGLNLAYGPDTYHVKIEVSLWGVCVWLDGVLLHSQPWANDQPLGDGKVGVGTYAATAYFDNVSVSGYEGIGDPWGLRFTKIAGNLDLAMPDPLLVYDPDAGTYTMMAAGHDVWDLHDGCGFAYLEVQGDFSATVRVDGPFTGEAMSSWSKAGVMVRDSLAPGSKYVFYNTTRGNGDAMIQWRDADDDQAHWTGVPDVLPDRLRYPYYLRLERFGERFTGYHSPDGHLWNQGSLHTNPDFGDRVYVGFATSSHEEAMEATMVFSDFSIEWHHFIGDPRDLKFVKLAGHLDANMPNPSVIYDGRYTVTSAGHDIWDDQDGCAFAYTELNGDFSVVAATKITVGGSAFGGPALDSWSKAGVMVRDSLSPGSKCVFYNTTRGEGKAMMQWRAADNVPASWPGFADAFDLGLPDGTYDYLLRLDRQGNSFTGYYSVDANQNGQFEEGWTKGYSITNAIPGFRDTVYVGFALTSHEETVETTFDFYGLAIGRPDPASTEWVSSLYEEFSDGVADGFNEIGGTWSVADGQYVQSTENPPGSYRSWINVGHLTKYTLEVDCTPLSGAETKVIYARADEGENYRVDFWLDRSRLCIPAWGQGWDTWNFVAEGLALEYDRTYRVKIEVGEYEGVKVWLDGDLLHDQPWKNDVPLGDGKVGVGTWSGTSSFDNLKVYSGTPPPPPFAVLDISQTPGGYIFLYGPAPILPSTYTVEYRDSLTEGDWQPGGILGEYGEWYDTEASGARTRFYKIRKE